MNTELAELHYWIQSYLHQDFDAEFISADDALVAYQTEESSQKVEKLKHDLTKIIQSNHDEATLGNLLLTQLGCGYYYPSEWKSARDWLRHLKELLSQ